MKIELKTAAVLAAAVLLTAFGCSKPEDDAQNGPAPELELDGKIVMAEPSGGTCSMAYTLTNPDGSRLEGRSSESWCHSFAFDQESAVMTFSVDANNTQMSRVANVYVCYGELEKKFAVSQAGAGEDLEAIATMDFDIEYEIDGPHVRMTVDPEFDNVRYYIAYSTKEEVERLGDNKQAVMKANVEKYLSGEVNALVNYGGYTVVEALDQYTGRGTRTIEMDLNGLTSWYGWCCAVSNEMKVISAVVMEMFTTGEIPPSDNVLTPSVQDVNCDRVTVNVTATNSDQWAAIVLPASEVDGKSDEQIRALFNSSAKVTDYLHFGDYSGTIKGLEPQTGYCLLVFGYEYGFETTEIKKENFTTLSLGDGVTDISLAVEDYTHYRAECRVTSSEKTALYYVSYLVGDETVEEAVESLDEDLTWMESAGYGDRLSLLRTMGYRGDVVVSKTDLRENTKYTFIAMAVDENTGKFNVQRDGEGKITSGVFVSESFTTPAAKISDAYANVVYDKYFSGTEYALHYPEDGADAIGLAVFPVTIDKSSDVKDFWFCIYSGDLTDKEKLPDEELRDYLIGFTYTDDDGYEQTYPGDGIKNEDSYLFLCDFDRELTIVSVAYDNEDNWSEVRREKIVFTEKGCSSWTDYPVASAVKSLAMPMVKSIRK